MINPDPKKSKGKYSIHEPLPKPFMENVFVETNCQVDSFSIPNDFDARPVVLEKKDEYVSPTTEINIQDNI